MAKHNKKRTRKIRSYYPESSHSIKRVKGGPFRRKRKKK